MRWNRPEGLAVIVAGLLVLSSCGKTRPQEEPEGAGTSGTEQNRIHPATDTTMAAESMEMRDTTHIRPEATDTTRGQ
jgi:hypothetical protein